MPKVQWLCDGMDGGFVACLFPLSSQLNLGHCQLIAVMMASFFSP